MIEFTYKPDWPWLVAGGLAVAGLLYWSYRAARGQANQRHRWVLFALRCVTLLVVVVCLLDPQRVKASFKFVRSIRKEFSDEPTLRVKDKALQFTLLSGGQFRK